MQKTKIEWTDYSWNPIKGLCPVDCMLPDGRSYCYARKIYKRFGYYALPSNPWRIWCSDVAKIQSLRKPSRIFVCSTFELFHPVVEKEDRNSIFNVIKNNPHHTFQILTKFPENIDRPMPDNVWLGVTITGERQKQEAFYLGHLGATLARLRFISIEPLISPIAWIKDFSYLKHFNWIIIGRLTQHGHKYDPKKEWIEEIVKKAKSDRILIFLKNNLKKIWGEPLIQEFPNIAEESTYQQNINS